jgi:DNA repair exonuclease SbcCD nuclease subunit
VYDVQPSAGTVLPVARRQHTFLHTSDCHLGTSRDGGREEVAFEAMVDLAIAADVDFVLLAGDLFDSSRVTDETLEFAAAAIDRLDRPVVLLVGNHDVLHEASIHHRFQAERRCRQVQFLDQPDGSVVRVPGTDVVVWARAMVEHEPGYRPFAGLPTRPADLWAVAAGHGLVVGEPTSERSSTITPADLDLVDWDYVALGHVHAHRLVRESPVPVCYPGATAASLDGAPGVVLVDLVPDVGAVPRWTSLEREGDPISVA